MYCLNINLANKILHKVILKKNFFELQRTLFNGVKTALYDFHIRNGGKIVNFGGYSLPVQYTDQSVIESHEHTRRHVSIFDVSHMLQTYISGKDAIEIFEPLCTADIRGIKNGSSSLTVFTNSLGGILDDLIVTKINEQLLYVVSNAAMREQDQNIIMDAVSKSKLEKKDIHVEFKNPSDLSLIAVQGPSTSSLLKELVPSSVELNKLYFMQSISTELAGISNCRITRCGYTGEDGVEISAPSDKIERLTESLMNTLSNQKVRLAGLGARDSLRLEAGLCLYGNDIDQNTTPAEAGLAWLVAKRRRMEQNFPGAKHICEQLNQIQKPESCRVGLQMIDSSKNPPARAGALIYNGETQIGHITSGCPSPTLKKNIAMGYIKENFKKTGTIVQLKIRNKLYDSEVVKMPFVKTNYYIPPKLKKT